ncbi:MAG: VWA domain-containing protein [Gammaproteobacteria bacterium]|nr:VWA domain-containing protein [Gammaproteobacteria bacterium]
MTKFSAVLLTISLFVLSHQTAIAKPKPKVKANSAELSISTNSDNSIAFSISLDAEEFEDVNADWWLYVNTPAGWFYYDDVNRGWMFAGPDKDSILPTFQGQLTSFDSFEIDTVSGLPAGRYELFFAVDTTMDGDQAGDEVFQDSIFINVKEEKKINVTGGVTILDIEENNGQYDLVISALDSINLKKADITVIERYEDGDEQTVLRKAKVKKVNNNPPLRLSLVLDRSGSLNNNEEKLMENGVLQMLGYLKNGDQVEVINAASNYYVDASFRSYKATPVANAIKYPSVTSGWTRINDAIIRGIRDADAHSKNSRDQKAVLVITDGEDNRSNSTIDSVIGVSQQTNTPVFVVGLADESDPTDLNLEGLSNLARQTGGRFVEVFTADFFNSILGGLASSLTAPYEIAYRSKERYGKRTIILKVDDGVGTYLYEKEFTPI